MYQRYQQLSPIAACLRKTGAILVLVFFWLLLAFALPAQVSAAQKCYWLRYSDRPDEWVCHDVPDLLEDEEEDQPTPEPTQEPTEEPTQEPTQEPTPDPPQQPEQPQQNIQLPPPPSLENNVGVNRNPDGAEDNSRDSASHVVSSTGDWSAHSCTNLPSRIQVFPYSPGAQCQIVSGAGIGDQSILDAGPLGAINVWGPANLQADVCFAAFGKIVFQNASTMPHSQQTLPVFYPGDGATCAYINNPGKVILLPGEPEQIAEAQAEPTAEPKKRSNLVFLIKDDIESAIALEHCQVRARQNIHIRLAPAGERTGLVVAGYTFTALARTDNWFKVVFDGAERWVSAHFVNRAGPCLPLNESSSAASIEDMRAREGNLSNLVFLIGDDPESAVELEDCQVSARQGINVRSAPAGQRTGLIMAGRSLRALARTDNWFMVALNGDERWVSAHFVNMRGACQPQSVNQSSTAIAASVTHQSANARKQGNLAFLLEVETDGAVSPQAESPAGDSPSGSPEDPGEISHKPTNLAFLLADEAVSAHPLADCRVRTLQNVHARVKPAGEATTLIADGQTVTALARTQNWFLVLFDGAASWVSAQFVYANGGCQ